MAEVPWNPVPGWDVPRDFYAPDEPDENQESFDEMVEERMSIQAELESDSDKVVRLLMENRGLRESLQSVREIAKHGTRNMAAWLEVIEITDKAIAR